MAFNRKVIVPGLMSLLIFAFSFQASAFKTNFLNESKSDDYLVVVKNHHLIFDVLKKKNQGKTIESIKVLKQPQFGEIYINNFDSLTYIPQPNICEENDEFTYQVETAEGHETITVAVEILCESLTILSGFSPNGDGINDTFTILGIQNFPKNTLTVFNKWGEEVYHKKGYQNEWPGKTEDDDDLGSEDSVYYYVFNDGEGKVFSGYLQIGENI